MRSSAVGAWAAAALLAMMTSGCATHLTSKSESAETLVAADRPGGSSTQQEASGLEAMAWEDKWTATNLFEHAEAGSSSVINRFNLATGYQRTARLPEAAEIYRSLLVDGKYTRATAQGSNLKTGERVRRFNVAEESARRLAVIELALAYASKLASAPVSDERARQRDQSAELTPKP